MMLFLQTTFNNIGCQMIRGEKQTLLGQRTKTWELLGWEEGMKRKREFQICCSTACLNFWVGWGRDRKCRSLGKTNCLNVGSDLEDIFTYFHIECSINQKAKVGWTRTDCKRERPCYSQGNTRVPAIVRLSSQDSGRAVMNGMNISLRYLTGNENFLGVIFQLWPLAGWVCVCTHMPP